MATLAGRGMKRRLLGLTESEISSVLIALAFMTIVFATILGAF